MHMLCRLVLTLTVFSQGIFAAEMDQKINKPDTRPNVVLILVDDLNDYQGIFGGHPQAKTPNIDKLAESGVRFSNAHSNVPVCQPSRNSMFTGVYPHRSKDFGWEAHYKIKGLKDNKTLVERFNETGYYTLGTGKLLHSERQNLWQKWGMNRNHNYGPFYFDGETMGAVPTVPTPYSDIGAVDGGYGRLSDVGQSTGEKDAIGWVYGWDKKPFRYVNDNNRSKTQDELHAQWAIQQLEQLARQENKPPFFMGVGFVRPHTPLYAPDRFFDLFPLNSLIIPPWLAGDNGDTFLKNNIAADSKGLNYYKQLLASYKGDREIAIKHFLQAYLACISFVDEQIGKVLNQLDSHPKLRDNTIVVFTSDHGWQMGEKNYLFKNSPWEESTRIPLIIRLPGNPHNGRQVAHPVSLIDIYPTLADYVQFSANHQKSNQALPLGGHSLRAFLENPATQMWQGPNGALSIIGNFGGSMKEWRPAKQTYSYRTKNWRYIRYANGQEELYDHQNDPYEWHNLAYQPKNQPVKVKLRRQINEIIGEELEVSDVTSITVQ
ncbi:sulfatase [Thalassotalea fonticola]|uniref:Sulfatase n=1 Tax=Thalassotalea fonticola TaxID=3065649 RepID=A0ABZ0GLH1_9GAMM|nr:sulfatase [Colwelliaceae bacterium S1-1]